jgi:hypothetical protein
LPPLDGHGWRNDFGWWVTRLWYVYTLFIACYCFMFAMIML